MESEVRKALQGIAGRKAVGVDNLPIERIKAVGEPAITALIVPNLVSHLYKPRKNGSLI
jgi:hypothetical protein